MAERIDIRLLGGVSVAVDGRPVRLAGRHAPALMALLALRPQPRSREAVAADLWPDSGSPSGLRQSLWLVRSAFHAAGIDPDTIIEADAEVIGLRTRSAPNVDAERFERLARGRSADPPAAVDLYAGDLAQGLDHECFAADRERLADLYEDALATVAQRRLAEGDLHAAREAAEELLARDALREEAHAVLIEVFGRSGTRSQVIRQWRRLTRVLRRELDVDPLPETEITFRHALATTLARSHRAVEARMISIGNRGARSGAVRPAPGRLTLAPTG
jgi:DNA-binding SARP family transcriptional activator